MSRSDVTAILAEIQAGGREAVDRLYPIVYRELRRLAHYHLRREPDDPLVGATFLVHEAYLRLVDQDRVVYEGKSHFFAAAARAMRRILVDHARKKGREKRGGGAVVLPLDAARDEGEAPRTDLVALDEALRRLAEAEPEKARVVELRFFAGLTGAEAATAMGVSERTVDRHWQYARAWLFRELGPSAAGPSGGPNG